MTEIDAVLFREFERAAHDRIAGSYQAFFVPVTANAATPLLDAVHASAGTRLLDIATGEVKSLTPQGPEKVVHEGAKFVRDIGRKARHSRECILKPVERLVERGSK